MSKKRSKDEIEASTIRWTESIRAFSSIVNKGIIWVGIVFCVFYFSQAISTLAGHTTNANILLSIITDLKANQWFGYVIGGSGIIYGGIQHKLRKKNISRLSGRVNYLEKVIDPNKGTSALTSSGETPENA